MARKARPRTADERRLLREIGAALRAARLTAQVSQETVAERTAIDVKYIQRLESGATNPQALTLARYAMAIGASFGAVFEIPMKPKRGDATRNSPPASARRRRTRVT